MGNMAVDTPSQANWPLDVRMPPDAAEKIVEALNLSGMGAAAPDRWAKIGVKALAGAALQAAVQAWQNPEVGAICITRIELDRTTKSAGASTMDIGTTATSAITGSDNLIDGVDSGATEGLEDNIENKGTNGKARQKLAAGKWITFQSKTGDTTGLVANAYIHYHLI